MAGKKFCGKKKNRRPGNSIHLINDSSLFQYCRNCGVPTSLAFFLYFQPMFSYLARALSRVGTWSTLDPPSARVTSGSAAAVRPPSILSQLVLPLQVWELHMETDFDCALLLLANQCSDVWLHLSQLSWNFLLDNHCMNCIYFVYSFVFSLFCIYLFIYSFQ